MLLDFRNTASGTASVSMGNYNYATGDATIALGKENWAEGASTVAIGFKNHAGGAGSCFFRSRKYSICNNRLYFWLSKCNWKC